MTLFNCVRAGADDHSYLYGAKYNTDEGTSKKRLVYADFTKLFAMFVVT